MFAKIVVFGVSLVVVSSAVVTPVCRLSQFDSCFANLALNLNSFPENDVIFDELCLNLNETRKCVEKYEKNCFSRIQTEMFSFISFSIRKRIEFFCEKQRNETKMHSKCLNREKVSHCFDKSAFQTAIRARSPSILCCALSRAQLCTDRALSTRCGESHARFFRQTLPLGEISQNLCQNSETKDCEKTLLIGLDVKSRDISTPFVRIAIFSILFTTTMLSI